MYKLMKDTEGREVTNTVIRISDLACIPFDPNNKDYKAYLAWLAEDNEPLPAE